MTLKRGDVVLVWYPFASGIGGKRRPCLILQNDMDNARLNDTIVAQITSNLRAVLEPTQLLIDRATPEGKLTGLLHNSLVSCNNLATIEQRRVVKVIGSLTPIVLLEVEKCLKAALGMP